MQLNVGAWLGLVVGTFVGAVVGTAVGALVGIVGDEVGHATVTRSSRMLPKLLYVARMYGCDGGMLLLSVWR